MARIYTHSESRAKGSVGMTTYRTIRGRVIQSQKVSPWDPSVDHVGGATRWNPRTALLGIISLWCSFHAQSLANSFNKTRYGSARNYFFKKNFAALREAFAILAEEYSFSKQAPEMALIEQALADYAAAHPSTIYRVKKSGYDVVFLNGAWDDSEDPVDPVVVNSISGVMNADFRLVSVHLVGRNINQSVKIYLGGVLIDGTLSISAGGDAGVFMPLQQVYVQGTKVLDCRVGSKTLASTSLEGDDRTYHTVSLGVTPAGGGACTGAGSYPEGTSVAIKAIPAAGYVFVKWSDDDINAQRSITVDQDINLTAQFEINSRKIKLYVASGDVSSISVDDSPVQLITEEGHKYCLVDADVLESHKVDVTPASGWNFQQASRYGSDLVEVSTDGVSWATYVTSKPFYARLKDGASGISKVNIQLSNEE